MTVLLGGTALAGPSVGRGRRPAGTPGQRYLAKTDWSVVPGPSQLASSSPHQCIAVASWLFLLCTDQSVKTGGDQVVAALQHPVGLSAVQGGNVRPIGKPDADREEDGQASTVVGRLEAILASFDGCDHALGLSEISQRVGLPKSTVHRLANQLCAVGWL